MKAEINKSGCISCGLCADICPEVFHQVGHEKASVKVREIPIKLKTEAETAEEQCPTNVIKIRK
jgi:ferredoxin